MNNKIDYELMLWKALRSGDEHAFTSLYNLFYKSLYNYGRKISNDPSLVEESINDLFIEIWRKRQNLSEVSSLRFYLFKALRRKLIRNVESAHNHFDIDLLASGGKEVLTCPSMESDIVQEEEVLERVKKVKNLLHNLPPRQYEALMLRYYEGFSFEEIAVIMKINHQTARNFAQRGIIHLRHISKVITSTLLFLKINFF